MQPASGAMDAWPRIFAVDGSDGESFRDHLDVEPFLFQHRLAGDPRFALPKIRALAARLPSKVSFSGDLPVGGGFTQPAATVRTFDQALGHLETGKSWIILKRIHEDPEYAPLLQACIAEAEARAHRQLEPLIESRTMSLILSSPDQVTPYHIDSDCNFLFQIGGRKTFYVFNGRDRSVLPEEEEERYWCGELNAAQYRAASQALAWSFALAPGNGVHVPVAFPHWVQNGTDVSISLSINFRFLVKLRGDVFRMNHLLRKLGLHPRAVGASPAIDSLKVAMLGPARAALGAVRHASHWLRRGH